MKVITSGAPYIDIDAYAGCIGYAELLQYQGHKAQAVSTSILNESITPTVRTGSKALQRIYEYHPSDTFTLLDVSDPDHFDTIVDLPKIEEVIDHHPGFEDYWTPHTQVRAHIEEVGAICTIIYEKFLSAGFENAMSFSTARLLLTGIIDNTLFFKAKINTSRDIDAYRSLARYANISETWPEEYLKECQSFIEEDINAAIKNDTKRLKFESFGTVAIGQLAVWDTEAIFSKHLTTIAHKLSAMNEHWFMNAIDIHEGKSYFFSQNDETKAWLSKVLSISFNSDITQIEHVWLRKEIMKKAFTYDTLSKNKNEKRNT